MKLAGPEPIEVRQLILSVGQTDGWIAMAASADVNEVDWQSEQFTYRVLWHAATALRAKGEAAEHGGFWSLLASLVLAYTAYEGFLNHVIESLYPQVWSQERTFFRVQPFEGTLGKTRFVAGSVGVKLERAARPYRTVAELHAWRNDLVHPRTVRGRGITRADAYARKPKRVEAVAFKKVAQRGFVSRGFDDLAALADSLLRAAGQQHTVDAREMSKLGTYAFWGPTGLGGASLRK
jgi:hypothetical protein